MIEGTKPKTYQRDAEFWTERYRITGKIYTPTGAGQSWRFSDILNKPDRPFVAVCDATIFSLNTNEIVWKGDFLVVNKESIVLGTSRD